MPKDFALAGRQLAEAHRSRIPITGLPDATIPNSTDESYAIQDAVAALCGPIKGWKVSKGNPPTCSPVFRVERSGVELDAKDFHGPLAEIEFGFEIRRNLPPLGRDYRDEEVFEAIDFVPVIEIVASRFADRKSRGKYEVLADGSNGALIAGTAIHRTGIDFRSMKVDLAINGKIVQEAQGTHALENPASLVVWLANHAARRCGGLHAGDVVTTGGLKGAAAIRAGDALKGRWAGFGELDVRLR